MTIDLKRTKLTLDEDRPYLLAVIDGTKISLDTPVSGGGPFYSMTVVQEQREVAAYIVRLWNDEVDRLEAQGERNDL